MEFGEKLHTLRKDKGLTQEELAEILHVSRTAVSKWESGRGYPNIDSIKDIASFFSVTVDELLSSEKILTLADKENKQNLQKMCDRLFGMMDLLTLMLIVLPLYPNPVSGHVYSVNLLRYTEASAVHIVIYWVIFLALAMTGILKIACTHLGIHKGHSVITWCSLGLSIVAVLLLSLSRQAYATILIFSLFIVKGFLYLKYTKP